jgi:hypothetical protein
VVFSNLVKSMKKVTLTAMAVLFSSMAMFAAHLPTDKAQSDTVKTKKIKPATANVVYTCGMHPDVLSDKPGRCSKCGMELVKREPAKKKTAADH